MRVCSGRKGCTKAAVRVALKLGDDPSLIIEHVDGSLIGAIGYRPLARHWNGGTEKDLAFNSTVIIRRRWNGALIHDVVFNPLWCGLPDPPIDGGNRAHCYYEDCYEKELHGGTSMGS